MRTPEEIAFRINYIEKSIENYHVKILDAIEVQNFKNYIFYTDLVKKLWIELRVFKWILN